MPAPTDNTLRTALEKKGVTFQIKTGNAKWQCTLLDRATHEKRKATRRSDSSSSEASLSTTSSNSSSSSSNSHH